MGKGDLKTKRGKINRGTSGVRRYKKKKITEIAVVEKPKTSPKKKTTTKAAEKKTAPKKTTTKKVAEKKTAPKKPTTKKAAEKKTAAKKTTVKKKAED